MGRPARISLYVTLALWGLLAASLLTRPPRNILSWDTFGYHLYLPAIFIHADPGIRDVEWVERAVTTYGSTGTLYQISQLPDGRWVNKYPMGMAVLWSPFFLAGHAVAHFTHAPGVFGMAQRNFKGPLSGAFMQNCNELDFHFLMVAAIWRQTFEAMDNRRSDPATLIRQHLQFLLAGLSQAPAPEAPARKRRTP